MLEKITKYPETNKEEEEEEEEEEEKIFTIQDLLYNTQKLIRK